jgi:hypothetical protein
MIFETGIVPLTWLAGAPGGIRTPDRLLRRSFHSRRWPARVQVSTRSGCSRLAAGDRGFPPVLARMWHAALSGAVRPKSGQPGPGDQATPVGPTTVKPRLTTMPPIWTVRQCRQTIILVMLNEIALVISSLGVGGLLGVFTKSILDKRQLKFSKVFEYKERRYQAITIMMLTAVNPSEYKITQLRMRRPDIDGIDDLDKELELEYHNSMLFASNNVLRSFSTSLTEKSLVNYQAVAQAMRKDLYL